MNTTRCRTVSFIVGLLLTLQAGGSGCFAADAPQGATRLTQAFLSAVDHYRSGRYREAANDLESIAAAGVVNGQLFYNLANAYLKGGELGRAILWYERARELIPSDPDLAFNYQHALTLVKDEGGEQHPIYRILFFWKYRLSHRAIVWAAVVLNALFWLILSARLLLGKKPVNAAAVAALAAALVFTLTAGYNYYEERHRKRGVILPAQVSVRSGLTADATELFVLHAGTRVRVQRENKDYLRIYFAPGKIGWVRKDDLGII